MTNECLKSRGKLPVDKERLTIFVMMGTCYDVGYWLTNVVLAALRSIYLVGDFRVQPLRNDSGPARKA